MKLKSILSIGLMMAVCPSWALDFGRIPENEISVYVQELDSGKVIAEHRADELRNPASTMKTGNGVYRVSYAGRRLSLENWV